MKTVVVIALVVVLLILSLTVGFGVLNTEKTSSTSDTTTDANTTSSHSSLSTASTASISAVSNSSTSSSQSAKFSISITSVIKDTYTYGYPSYILDVNMSVQNGDWYIVPSFFHLTLYNPQVKGYNPNTTESISANDDIQHPLNATYIYSHHPYGDSSAPPNPSVVGQISFMIPFGDVISSLDYNGSNTGFTYGDVVIPSNINISRIFVPQVDAYVSKVSSFTIDVNFNPPVIMDQSSQIGVGFTSTYLVGGCVTAGQQLLENMTCAGDGNLTGYSGQYVTGALTLTGNRTITSIVASNGFQVEDITPVLPFGCSGQCSISLKLELLLPPTTQSSFVLEVNAT